MDVRVLTFRTGRAPFPRKTLGIDFYGMSEYLFRSYIKLPAHIYILMTQVWTQT